MEVLKLIDLFCLEKLTTVLNKMIDTASLVIPSPKTRLKSFGYAFGFNRDTAAMTSVEQRREHISKTSTSESCKSDQT